MNFPNEQIYTRLLNKLELNNLELDLIFKSPELPSNSGLKNFLVKNDNPNNIIQFQGPPCSGKTQLLYKICSSIIVPKNWNGIHLNFLDPSSVIIVDNNLGIHFQKNRLKSVLRTFILNRIVIQLNLNFNLILALLDLNSNNNNNNKDTSVECTILDLLIEKFELKTNHDSLKEDLNLLISESLKRVIYIKPDSYKLDSLLNCLDTLLVNLSKSNTYYACSPSLLIIEGISTFYWDLVYSSSNILNNQNINQNTKDNKNETLESGYAKLIKSILNIQTYLKCHVICTTWTLNRNITSNHSDAFIANNGISNKPKVTLPYTWMRNISVQISFYPFTKYSIKSSLQENTSTDTSFSPENYDQYTCFAAESIQHTLHFFISSKGVLFQSETPFF